MKTIEATDPTVITTGRPRVLFVAPTAYVLSGLATWLDYLLPGLESRGWYAISGLVSGIHHDFEAYRKVHPDGKAIAIENPTGSREGRIGALASVIRAQAVDLVATVNIPDAIAAVARLRARAESRARIAMTIHSIDGSALGDARLWTPVVDGIVGSNRLTCRLVEDVGGAAFPRVEYAPYGVALGERRGERRADDDALRIAWVGRLENHQKRAEDLVGIVAELRRYELKWVLSIAGIGEAEVGLREALAEDVARGRVVFLGFVPPSRLREEVYSKTDVLLITSFWETGPIVLWEAMSEGVAAVSSRYLGSGREGSLRHRENCLLFSIGDVVEAAKGLAELKDGRLRAKLAEAGRELVESQYTQERSVEQWDLALRRILLSETPRPVPEELLAVEPAGRLDQLLGTRVGERIRRLVGWRFRHPGPGAEWPHTYHPEMNDAAFEERAKRLDGEAPGVRGRRGNGR